MEKPKIRNQLHKRSKNYSRVKGHNYERELAKEFRDILSEFTTEETCRTSRAESRLLDACKVDLTFKYLNVQAKNVRSNINYNSLIDSIREHLTADLPERSELPTAVFHKKGRDREFVVMLKDDFYFLLKQYLSNIFK